MDTIHRPRPCQPPRIAAAMHDDLACGADPRSACGACHVAWGWATESAQDALARRRDTAEQAADSRLWERIRPRVDERIQAGLAAERGAADVT